MTTRGIRKALLAEFLGTAMLLCAVIGSGIMAQRLSSGNDGIALLANTFATVFALYVLIEVFGPVSGAHFNPVVTLMLAWRGKMSASNRISLPLLYVVTQLGGAVIGALLANAMFDQAVLQVSSKPRASLGLWLAEVIAAAGLMFVVLRGSREKMASLVAAYIGAAYWFSSSTSFANPAAVVGRMLSDSFAGIAPASAIAFIAAQLVGGAIGAWVAAALDEHP
jgi:glycerol uptake facilitator-like aquaporin